MDEFQFKYQKKWEQHLLKSSVSNCMSTDSWSCYLLILDLASVILTKIWSINTEKLIINNFSKQGKQEVLPRSVALCILPSENSSISEVLISPTFAQDGEKKKIEKSVWNTLFSNSFLLVNRKFYFEPWNSGLVLFLQV